MELYQLKTFNMVAEEGNLTRAARRLHASQPAVSAHIKSLEDELGISLFLRTPKGMVLTIAGQKLKRHANRILESVKEMAGEAERMRGVLQGELRIGINAEPETLRISELFSRMRNLHPDLHLHLLQAMTGEVLNKLEEGELDAGFMYGENTSEKIWTLELRKLCLVVAGPTSWREELSVATAAHLGNFPWITTPADCPFHGVAMDFFKRHGLSPQEVAVVDQEGIIRSMIKAGAGISLLLEEEVCESATGEGLAVWRGEQLGMTLSVACLKRRKDEPMLQTLFFLLSMVWETAADNGADLAPGLLERV